MGKAVGKTVGKTVLILGKVEKKEERRKKGLIELALCELKKE